MSGTKGRSGGRREGAGRPPFDKAAGPRILRAVRLHPDTDKTVLANRCAGDSYASTLDRIVREWAERPSE